MDAMMKYAIEFRPRRTKRIELWSFGFKYGAMEADVVIDVRFLPNPYYESSLRFLTGVHPRCSSFVLQHEASRAFVRQLSEFIQIMREAADEQKRPSLKVAIGCTGGQHRSVAVVEELGRLLRMGGALGQERQLDIHHRDAAHWVLSDQPACH